MFCDIVSSTVLARTLEAEDMRRLLTGWRDRVVQAGLPFGGHVAQFLGDGALLYFGYPIARADDAERAVRAGLALLDEMRSTFARGPEPGAGDDRLVPARTRSGRRRARLVLIDGEAGTGKGLSSPRPGKAPIRCWRARLK